MDNVALSEHSSSVVQARRDPRDESDLSDRDYDALQYVLEGYEESQANVDLALFKCSSRTPVSRCVNRLVAAGYLKVERWHRIGVNLLRGTTRGCKRLIERGVDASMLFVPEKPVAAKDLAHHMWINETRLALSQIGLVDVWPCWTLRRKLGGRAIPDLLAFQTDEKGATTGVLAVEIDLGSEPLKNVFLPKLDILRELLAAQAAGQPAAILVLTVGPRRIQALEAGIANRPHEIPIVVTALPKATGRASIVALVNLLRQLRRAV